MKVDGAAGRAAEAHKRLLYLADLKMWLDGYINELTKTDMDGINPVDPNVKGAALALKARMNRMILKDGIEVAEMDLQGKPVWQKPEF